MPRRTPIFAAVLIGAASLGAPSAAQDFDGAYVGAGVSAGPGTGGQTDLGASAFVGYNWTFGDKIVAGGELDLTYSNDALWGDTAAVGTLDARLGFLVTDNVLLYGRAGTGYADTLTGSYVWDLGAGGEYMLDNGLAIRGEVDRVDPFTAGLDTQVNGRLGVVMNF